MQLAYMKMKGETLRLYERKKEMVKFIDMAYVAVDNWRNNRGGRTEAASNVIQLADWLDHELENLPDDAEELQEWIDFLKERAQEERCGASRLLLSAARARIEETLRGAD